MLRDPLLNHNAQIHLQISHPVALLTKYVSFSCSVSYFNSLFVIISPVFSKTFMIFTKNNEELLLGDGFRERSCYTQENVPPETILRGREDEKIG